MDKESFYTFNEYMKNEESYLTASMEDYVEMIYRLSKDTGFTRIHDLSEALNVQPPSATKMVQRLAQLNLLNYEKYGMVVLQEKGKQVGAELLNRHNTVESFLRIIGVAEEELLEETEKIEHTISNNTREAFNDYMKFIAGNPDVMKRFKAYKMGKRQEK